MNNRISVATINSPEFINLQQMDINPMMSKCEVKVLYVGQNRNRSSITKEVATKMSKTLRGCPIVGYYIENKEDFGDHGDQVVIDGEGIKFNKLTKPYGFVAPDAKVWFQFFEDKDEFGNTCLREYLMTEGYLWTEQFAECKRVLENSNPQSMELDEKSLKGFWSTDNNSGIDFFIINDAVFSKLCILGDDVEPCFEGARVSAPDLSSQFSKNDEFVRNLFTMMEELKFALNNNQGGLSMENLETPIVEEPVVEAAPEAVVETETPVENFSAEEDKTSEIEAVENENTVEEFAKKEDEEKKEEEKSDSEDSKSEDAPAADEKSDEEEDKKKKYELLEADYAELQNKYASLEEENKILVAFKNEVENKQKDELIASFYMLSDEDKKDVIENKTQYSLEDIESKLSVICVRKRVNFADETQSNDEVVTTFNLNAVPQENVPEWIQAVKANMN